MPKAKKLKRKSGGGVRNVEFLCRDLNNQIDCIRMQKYTKDGKDMKKSSLLVDKIKFQLHEDENFKDKLVDITKKTDNIFIDQK